MQRKEILRHLTGRVEMETLPFRLDISIFIFTTLLFIIKLKRLNIPFLTVMNFDYNIHGEPLWQCYEMVSGSYILINLLMFLYSGFWITEPDSHWLIYILPGLVIRILKYCSDCGLFGVHHPSVDILPK